MTSRRGRRLVPSRLGLRDVAQVGSAGLRGRPVRVVLSALGIAIGIATMIAVVGISASSKAKLMRDLDRLGTNMLVVKPGQSLFSDEEVRLPKSALRMVSRIDGVEHVAATGSVDASVYRSEHIPKEQTGGIQVSAATEGLKNTLRGSMATGTWFNGATGSYPSVVLGTAAAERLGITEAGQRIRVGDEYYTVLGILRPLPLAPEIDNTALVGWENAQKLLGFDGHPTSLYERSADDQVERVRELLARTVNPEAPHEIDVSDPSAALQAKTASEGAFSSLLLGLGGVALLVGGVGIANTMIISVLERKHEIGLRRSFGATRGQIRLQFVTESLMLSGLGGLAGVVLGALATYIYANVSGMPWTIPPWAMAGGFGATLVIGTIAGLYPAVRASKMSPTLALHAS
ncbi:MULTISPECIES: ABC transporter permease [unclassified Streptomyces]|uniref:ABC transporter permease n=1 Tax=unclassified Streptomyces TaxID=2593676 RepID=UPI00362DD846